MNHSVLCDFAFATDGNDNCLTMTINRKGFGQCLYEIKKELQFVCNSLILGCPVRSRT